MFKITNSTLQFFGLPESLVLSTTGFNIQKPLYFNRFGKIFTENFFIQNQEPNSKFILPLLQLEKIQFKNVYTSIVIMLEKQLTTKEVQQ